MRAIGYCSYCKVAELLAGELLAVVEIRGRINLFQIER